MLNPHFIEFGEDQMLDILCIFYDIKQKRLDK